MYYVIIIFIVIIIITVFMVQLLRVMYGVLISDGN